VSGEKVHGTEGERIVERLLRYAGWEILERQVLVHGHRIDLLAIHVDHGETLFEVKVWSDPRAVGTDNVKKAIADAYDLWTAGETRPYVLVLSHELAGLHRAMFDRAIAVGAIAEVWVGTLMPVLP
jgi:Holliday junction resolvase-like predicted endonuclease